MLEWQARRGRRTRIQGYTDLGPVAVPPRPPGCALVDRDDGNTYYITETAGGSSPPIVLTALPSNWTDPIYSAGHEPVIETAAGRVRIYSSNGALGNEAAGDDTARQRTYWPPVYTRRAGFTANIYKVVAPSGFTIGDALELELATG